MPEHKPIQDPKKFTEKDYQKFEYILLSVNSSQEQLEEIVMLLAHLPTKQAQEILKKFKRSERAEEVPWLDVAMQEGQMHYVWPQNEQEERDLKALKLYHEKNDRIIEMMGEKDGREYQLERYQIELDALLALKTEDLSPEEKEDLKYRIMALEDLMRMEKSKLEEVTHDIELEEKINRKIKESIRTERYKNLESWDISGFHFDGEAWLEEN